jgi:hypothetical protein
MADKYLTIIYRYRVKFHSEVQNEKFVPAECSSREFEFEVFEHTV